VAVGAAVDVLVDVAEADEDVDDDVVGTISDGKYSPGLNINVAFLAYASCVSNVSVEF
jgi:hypothetical protein